MHLLTTEQLIRNAVSCTDLEAELMSRLITSEEEVALLSETNTKNEELSTFFSAVMASFKLRNPKLYKQHNMDIADADDEDLVEHVCDSITNID